MNAWDLLKSIGVFAAGSTILLTALGFIGRSVFVHFLSHDLESHKAKLAADNAIALEQFRAQLQTAAFEHETRFSHLHEERGKIIAELYKRLAIADEEIHLMIVLGTKIRLPEERRLKVSEAVNGFRDYFEQHRCYFDRALCEVISTLSVKLLKALSTEPSGVNNDVTPENVVMQVTKSVTDIINMRSEIENRLRDMLGVGEPTRADTMKAREITMNAMTDTKVVPSSRPDAVKT
jgi:hypothetical protein